MSAPDPITLDSSIGLDARKVAVFMLEAVLERAQPLEAQLSESRLFRALNPQDRAFAQRLIKTVLRRRGQIDALLKEWLNRPLPPKQVQVQNLLRIGIAQLLWMEVPPHAAVSTTVELARQLKYEPQAGMINAVLRRCTREAETLLSQQDECRLNTPAWLWNRWVKAYGEPASRTLAEQHVQEPPIDLSLKHPHQADAWAGTLGGEALPTGTVRLRKEAGSITALAGYDAGEWWVQDAASALPVYELQQHAGALAGKTVLDMCAAPGGKAAQLAAAGAHVTALERVPARAQMLKENLERLQLAAEVIVTDALNYRPDKPPDAILLDAPCSATGTLRRHPDVAWHRKPEDIARLAKIQRALLHHAWELLKPGGLLVYAVCSLQPEEGEEQIAAFLQAHSEARHLQSRLLPPALAEARPDFACPALQNAGSTDGFFMAVITKQET